VNQEAVMAKIKVTKTSKIFSDNEKMDNSGLAGKPKEYPSMEWKQPTMSIKDIMEVQEYKTNKRPDTEED
jgi:hypothetical protein